jgi:transcriptional regulator with XRE-family HTH domain
LPITAAQRAALRRLVRQPTAPQREVRRALIILHRADGLSQAETARRVGVNRPVVVVWEQRFREAGLAGLAEAKGRGRKPSVALETKAAIVSRATQPPPGRSRWSVRSMAQAAGVSKATVQRLWAANAIKPHLSRAFKLSNDPQFEAKFWDVIGLYLAPPEKALVLCCDEKSQCQALERTQPDCRLASAMCARAPTTIPVTAPSPCSRRCPISTARSSARPRRATPTGTGWGSSSSSTTRPRAT